MAYRSRKNRAEMQHGTTQRSCWHQWQPLGRSLLAVLLVLVVCGCLSVGKTIAAPMPLTIQQARQQPNGAEVSVAGVVTVPSGLFRSANLDEGFAIQDETAGIYVTTPQKIAAELGQAIAVRGRLQDDGHGQRLLRLTHWQPVEQNTPTISPQVASLQQAGKQLDGKLVTVVGKIARPLQEDAPYGDRLWIQDDTGEMQVYIPKSTQIHPEAMPQLSVGQWIRVTGLSSQYDDSDEVVPRSSADIGFLAVP